MHRPMVSVFLAVSLDGFIAGEGGDLSWLSPYASDPPEATGYAALMRETDAMVMGRNTYDAVLGFGPWPYEGKRVVVLTGRELRPRHGEERADVPLHALLRDLGKAGHRHVYLDGGAVVRDGLRAGLVDSLTLSRVPVVLGKGIALFDQDLPRATWRMHSTRSLPSGLVQTRYLANLAKTGDA